MHKTIIGRSGFGKSTFLEHLILGTQGGFAFVDPHGQSAQRIADSVPCIYWDASEGLVCFNPLANVSPDKRALVAAQVVYAIKAVAGELSWGPRLNWTLYNAVRLALDNNGTILDIYDILTDKDLRARFLRRASFAEYWEGEFARYSDKFRDEVIAPVLNKIGMFKANPLLNKALSDNTISLHKVMAKGQNLVINLAKAQLGDEPAHLLGALIIAGFYNAAQMRPFDPPVFTLFADEFQNFATQSFADILSEARKYGLHVVLAHQFLAQIPKDLLPAVFANVGQITAFNLSADDAAFLGREMDLNPQMLQDLSKFEAWQKTGLVTQLVGTFPPCPTQGRLEGNCKNTRARYARLHKILAD